MPGDTPTAGLTGVAKEATDSLLAIPSNVMMDWPYILGFGLIDFIDDRVKSMLSFNAYYPGLSKSLYSGFLDTVKFTYYSGGA